MFASKHSIDELKKRFEILTTIEEEVQKEDSQRGLTASDLIQNKLKDRDDIYWGSVVIVLIVIFIDFVYLRHLSEKLLRVLFSC